jgi:hypothetical protein
MRQGKSRWPLLAYVVAASALGLSAQSIPAPQTPASTAPMPDVLPVAPGSGPSFWVSAKAAADRDNVLKWELFGETTKDDVLHGYLQLENERAEHPKNGNAVDVEAIPEKSCPNHTVSSVFAQAADPAETLAGLINGSLGGIYAGTVIAVTPGFILQAPAEVLTVRVDEALVGLPAPRATYSQLYVAYGVAHFRIGTYYFCGLPSDSWGEPEVGNRLLVFVDRWARPGTAFVLPSVEDQLIIQTSKGIHLPAALGKKGALSGVKTFDAAVEAVRLAIKGAQR